MPGACLLAGFAARLFGPRFILALCVASLAFPSWGITFYVSPDGNDSWSGGNASKGSKGPFATIERARDAVRSFQSGRGRPDEKIVVEIQAGTYRLSRPLIFGQVDGGSRDNPVVYRAAEGADSVRIVGAVPVRKLMPLAGGALVKRFRMQARQNILRAEVKVLHGEQRIGKLTPRGHSTEVASGPTQLYFRGKPMPLARWPNSGFLTIAALVDDGKAKFVFDVPIHGAWEGEPELWAHGYWYWNWADELLPVTMVQDGRNLVEMDMTASKYGMRHGQRFYFLNILSEIDAPGEWYLDHATGTLYFWPPAVPDAPDDVEISVLEPLVSIKETAYLEFSGLTFEMSRGNGIEVQDSRGVTVRDSVVRNVGGYAVRFQNCTDSGVFDSAIYDTGDGGVFLNGGNRQTLEAGNLNVRNTHIFRFSQLTRTSRPAIWLSGVGNVAASNHIHDGPGMGLYFAGNDHTIEFNEIDHIGLETDDVGAIYVGRDWSARGNVVRNNYIHDLMGMRVGAMGVYMDDQASGVKVESNVFANVELPVMIGGGRDNQVTGNVFVGIGNAIRVDNRGMGCQKNYWSEPDGEIRRRLEATPWDREPYLSRYPELANVLVDRPGAPVGNRISGNLAIGQSIGAVTGLDWQFIDLGTNYTLGDVHCESAIKLFRENVAVAIDKIAAQDSRQEVAKLIAGIQARKIGLQCHSRVKACLASE